MALPFMIDLHAPIQVPQFQIPRLLAGIAARLPKQPPTLVLLAALNLALDRILPRDVLQPLLGRSIALRVTDAGLSLRLTLTERGFRTAGSEGPPDLAISASACDFLALALRQEDPDTLFFSRRLLMEGDTELGLLVKNTLDGIDLPQPTLADLAPHRLLAAALRRRA